MVAVMFTPFSSSENCALPTVFPSLSFSSALAVGVPWALPPQAERTSSNKVPSSANKPALLSLTTYSSPFRAKPAFATREEYHAMPYEERERKHHVTLKD